MVEFKPIYIIIILFVLISAVLVFYIFQKVKPDSQKDALNIDTYKTITAKVNDKTYNLKIADTNTKRSQGLMYTNTLPKDEGMLFIFPKSAIYPFWMKNTNISLDMVWLDEDKRVVFIKENAQPCANTAKAICKSIIPTKKSKYVVELNAGEVQKSDIKIEDTFGFQIK